MYMDDNTSSEAQGILHAEAILSMGQRVAVTEDQLWSHLWKASQGRPISETGQGRETECEYRQALVWTEHRVCWVCWHAVLEELQWECVWRHVIHVPRGLGLLREVLGRRRSNTGKQKTVFTSLPSNLNYLVTRSSITETGLFTIQLFLLLLNVFLYAPECLHVYHVCSKAHRDQKRSLELELYVIVSCHVSARDWTHPEHAYCVNNVPVPVLLTAPLPQEEDSPWREGKWLVGVASLVSHSATWIQLFSSWIPCLQYSLGKTQVRLKMNKVSNCPTFCWIF